MNDQTSGEWWIRGAVWLVGLAKNIVVAIVFVGLAVAVVLPDLALGPQFLFSYAHNEGVDLGPLTKFVPWGLSFATTGFQYLIYHRLGQGGLRGASKHDRLAVAMAAVLAVIDTIIDVGGMTSLVFSDPEQGARIVPAHPNVLWGLLAILVIGVCGFHEVILAPLLIMGAKAGNERAGATPGAFIVEGAVWVLGQLFGVIRGCLIFMTIVGVLGLDLILGPQFLFAVADDREISLDGWLQYVPWVLTIAMTGFQLAIYRLITLRGVKNLNRQASVALYLGAGLGVVDTIVDVAGFTAFMYGADAGVRVFPPHATVAWGLLALLVATLCGLWEWLMEGLLSTRRLASAFG